MADDHSKFRAFVTGKLSYLSDNIITNEKFLDYFVNADCLSITGKHEILAQKTPYNMISNLLLNEIVTRGPSTLPHMIHALRETKQIPMAEMLEQDGAEFLANLSQSFGRPAQKEYKTSLLKSQFRSPSTETSQLVNSNTTQLPTSTSKLQRFRADNSPQPSNNGDLYSSGILTKYRMESSPRGFALIINLIDFGGIPKLYRDGAEYDSNQLGRLLDDFNYEVYLENDLKSTDFFDKIDAFLEMFNETPVDSCIVSIMTHGAYGDFITASDRKQISLKQVLEKFNNVHCPQLNGKPKIFFMQHCRGDETDKGATTVVFDGPPKDEPPGEGRAITVPTWTDMLVCYSTLEGYYSFREEEKGTWFIQILCEVFKKYSKQLDICKMLNLVATEMKMKKTGKVKISETVQETGLKQICPYYNIGFSSDFYFQ